MKENVLDVLMYLFESYMDEEVDINPDQESLKLELMEAGFPHTEIDKALDWLEGLALLQDQPVPYATQVNPSLRIFTDHEIAKLDVAGCGYLQFLQHSGVLDPIARELVIDRVMALGAEEISLEELKWVVLMVLFNRPGQEAAFAWMKNIVFDETAGNLH